MAIKIPSKHIYGDKQNSKIRDNVIERIEVGAVEISPKNETNAQIYTSQSISSFDTVESQYVFDFQKTFIGAPDGQNFITAISYSGYKETKLASQIDITIPIVKDNKRITTVKVGEDRNGDPNVSVEVFGIYQYGTIICPYEGEVAWVSGNNYELNVNFDINNSEFYSPVSTETGNYQIPKLFQYTAENYVWGGSTIEISVSSEIEVESKGNLKNPIITKDEENIYISLSGFICGLRSIEMGGTASTTMVENGGFPVSSYMSGVWKEYTPTYIEITVYGNTIGIDLQDKTIYLPETDKTSKKVFSMERNELLQTVIQHRSDYEYTELTNGTDYTYEFRDDEHFYADFRFDSSFWGNNIRIAFSTDNGDRVVTANVVASADTVLGNGGYHIDSIIKVELIGGGELYDVPNNLHKVILDHYKNGKETATIRCSISDYYDYNSNDKVIAIDNSTRKMIFDIGDQVIPMVYGANGQDKPMSLNKDGTPKAFNVLGVRPFFDGAVWQELSLQEV